MVQELLNNGANVNTADTDSCNPLHIAGQEGHVEVVRELLKHGANVKPTNKGSFTCLYIAGGNGHVDVVLELLKHGASGLIAYNLHYSH